MSDKSFSESMKNLRSAADRIGGPTTSLEEALALFDAGMKESEYLNSVLEKAEQKIEIFDEQEGSSHE